MDDFWMKDDYFGDDEPSTGFGPINDTDNFWIKDDYFGMDDEFSTGFESSMSEEDEFDEFFNSW